MKEAVKAVVATIFVIAVFLGIIFLGQNKASTAPADPAPLCTTNVSGHHVHIHCTLAGLVILDTNLPISIPTVRVTIPPPPPVTVRSTVHVPGPTRTVTVNNSPRPGPTTTKTVTVNPGPSSAPTGKVGQTPTTRVTITPSPQVREHTTTVTHQKTNTIVHRVFLGTLLAIGLLLLAILAAIGGYYFGYKDSDKREQSFLQSLMERVRGERD